MAKFINNIVNKLKTNAELTSEEKSVAAFIIEESERIEKNEGKNYLVEMSPETYQWFVKNAYKSNGDPVNVKQLIF